MIITKTCASECSSQQRQRDCQTRDSLNIFSDGCGGGCDEYNTRRYERRYSLLSSLTYKLSRVFTFNIKTIFHGTMSALSCRLSSSVTEASCSFTLSNLHISMPDRDIHLRQWRGRESGNSIEFISLHPYLWPCHVLVCSSAQSNTLQ